MGRVLCYARWILLLVGLITFNRVDGETTIDEYDGVRLDNSVARKSNFNMGNSLPATRFRLAKQEEIALWTCVEGNGSIHYGDGTRGLRLTMATMGIRSTMVYVRMKSNCIKSQSKRTRDPPWARDSPWARVPPWAWSPPRVWDPPWPINFVRRQSNYIIRKPKIGKQSSEEPDGKKSSLIDRCLRHR